VSEVVEVSPRERFSHTFTFTMRDEEPRLVTWKLADVPTGCRVTLTHGGWSSQLKTHKGVGGGWTEILTLLAQVLETGRISQ